LNNHFLAIFLVFLWVFLPFPPFLADEFLGARGFLCAGFEPFLPDDLLALGFFSFDGVAGLAGEAFPAGAGASTFGASA
jgi:hypothetical protein